jgi:hypothetical protein
VRTANLLAYSDLFRAGIARSGAFNHTLRPFGFQSEHRTLYKARDTYTKLSPTLNADKIDEPLLIIHGALDVNPGTVPLQSEKLFEAVRGVGGTTRLVMLPFESHGYLARESVEHVIAERIASAECAVYWSPMKHPASRPTHSRATIELAAIDLAAVRGGTDPGVTEATDTTALSIMKTNHDTVKNSISNVR